MTRTTMTTSTGPVDPVGTDLMRILRTLTRRRPAAYPPPTADPCSNGQQQSNETASRVQLVTGPR